MYLWGIFYRPCGIPSRRRIGKDGLIFRLVYFATVGERGGGSFYLRTLRLQIRTQEGGRVLQGGVGSLVPGSIRVIGKA